ncbi:MAG: HAD family hydrolase [Gemmatimonadota bacterium]|jgi:FMN phosphatase YigB (HAD superfamily)
MDQEATDVVVLVDVDNTLLDNDRVEEDLHAHLIQRFGEEAQKGYWAIFEELRGELGYADYLGALQRFRLARPHDGHVVGMSSWLVDYPFADRLYPGALDVVRELARHVTTVILTDGDVVFQPRKVQRSGIGAAAGERILIYVHKEQELDDVERRYPARHYVVVDDKLRILSAIKGTWGTRVTTVFVRQGHYAEDADVLERYPPADITLETIRDLSVDTLRRHGAL